MRHLTTLLAAAAAASLLSTGPAYADLGDQLAKLLADDGAAEDWFGVSVAIGGATAIVGASLDDDNGPESGSAYLFDISDPAKPVQLFKLLADDGAAGDQFGFSVAISETTAIIGAAGDDDNGNFSGSAYLFDISDPKNPVQIAKLLPDDGAELDVFGNVAISGATAIVGARRDDDNGANSGSAYLFDTTTGEQLFKLLAKDGAANDLFGDKVAISGTTAIVGAYHDDDYGNWSGSAYLFDTTTGRQLFKLLPDDGAANELFGGSVAISETTAIVGAYWDDDNGFRSGSAYLFDISDPANPTQIAKLLANDGAEGNYFGHNTAIAGDIAVVGAYRDDDACPGDPNCRSGSAYLFDISDPANPTQIAKLLANDGAEGDYFGHNTAIAGDIVVVGAFLDDDNGSSSGSAYIFDAGGFGKCPWDLDANGTVGVKDLLILLGEWGPCPKQGDCPADFDDSGDVGVKDLLFLLGAWGPCP